MNDYSLQALIDSVAGADVGRLDRLDARQHKGGFESICHGVHHCYEHDRNGPRLLLHCCCRRRTVTDNQVGGEVYIAVRHPTAMHLLQAGVDLSVIALWLGHESIDTTHMYVEADLAMNERALSAMQLPSVKPPRFRPNEDMLAFLEGL